MTGDRPLLGIVLMLLFCLIAPIGDALAKVLGQAVPLGQLLLVRFALQAVILIPVLWLIGGRWWGPPRLMALILLRTLLHIAGIGAMFMALRYLPLADAVAIAFVMPFLMLLLGKYVLDEEVGMRRIMACAVGFCGTLMVIQPSFVDVGLPALLPLVVAVVFSLFMLVTRQIAKSIDPVSLQAVSGTMATVILIPAMFLGPAMGWVELTMVPVNLTIAGLLVAIGLLGTLAHLVMTWALKYAPSATLAPMQYLEIPFATVVGWLVFGDLPNGLAAVGICVTMAAGLYVVFRERATSRAAVKAPLAPVAAPPAAE